MKPKYNIHKTEEISTEMAQTFVELLLQQRKVQNPTMDKIKRCLKICYAEIDNDIGGIGAIKRKTALDFSEAFSNLPELSTHFTWELGYLYILPKYEGHHLGSEIVDMLLAGLEHENLMASTEIETNPAMVQILKKRNFVRHGNAWKSVIHDDLLGLFLRYK